MLTLNAKIRKEVGKKVKSLRQKGIIPAVLYGPKIKNENLEINLRDFEKVFREAGASTLISLEIENGKKYLVLIHGFKKDPLTETPIHIDFYQPSLEEKIEARVPIILQGESPAVKNLGGTLYKNIAEIQVRALPQHLPKEIKVDISGLNAFQDHIKIKHLKMAEGVEILKDPEEVVVSVSPPEKVEEELQKPLEEKVEDVEKIEKEKKPAAEVETKEEKVEAAPKRGEPRPASAGREKNPQDKK